MATIIPNVNAGIAMTSSEEFESIELFSGDFPKQTTTETVATATVASAALPAYSVVGRNGAGNLVMATDAGVTDPIAPIGITAAPVPTGLTNPKVPVHRAGCFNPDALNWDATFNTDAKKAVAFEGSQPTIFIRKPSY